MIFRCVFKKQSSFFYALLSLCLRRKLKTGALYFRTYNNDYVILAIRGISVLPHSMWSMPSTSWSRVKAKIFRKLRDIVVDAIAKDKTETCVITCKCSSLGYISWKCASNGHIKAERKNCQYQVRLLHFLIIPEYVMILRNFIGWSVNLLPLPHFIKVASSSEEYILIDLIGDETISDPYWLIQDNHNYIVALNRGDKVFDLIGLYRGFVNNKLRVASCELRVGQINNKLRVIHL